MTLPTLLVTVALAAAQAPVQSADSACQVLKPKDVPVVGRKSPLDSLTFLVARRPIKLCYGRPSARGRVMLGGEPIPYGKLWRTGANEPTIFFTPISVRARRGANFLLEWERTRVPIPIRPA
jgi:hypothetical protein